MATEITSEYSVQVYDNHGIRFLVDAVTFDDARDIADDAVQYGPVTITPNITIREV